MSEVALSAVSVEKDGRGDSVSVREASSFGKEVSCKRQVRTDLVALLPGVTK